MVPALEVPVAELESTGARLGHLVDERRDAALQGNRRRRELPRGARRISALNHLVVQRASRIVVECFPEVLWNAPDELVGIERRRAVKREDGAGSRVERDRAALQRVGEQRRGVLLQLEIDVRVE